MHPLDAFSARNVGLSLSDFFFLQRSPRARAVRRRRR
jgi:hypothetical protein